MQEIELPTEGLFKEIGKLEKQYKSKTDYESWVRLTNERQEIYRRFAMEGASIAPTPPRKHL